MVTLKSVNLLFLALVGSVAFGAEEVPLDTYLCQHMLLPAGQDGTSQALRDVLTLFQDKIAPIRRPSKGEAQVVEMFRAEASSRNLHIEELPLGGIRIEVPATGEFIGQNLPKTGIQFHVDMVEAVRDVNRDVAEAFAHGVQLAVTNGELHAVGWKTSAGLDNGLGAAMGLRLIANPSIPHGPLSLFVTTQEEIGCKGANFDPGVEKMISLDGQDFGQIWNGCLGAQFVQTTSAVATRPLRPHTESLTVQFKATGESHSGFFIHRSGINTVLASAELLRRIQLRLPEVQLLNLLQSSAAPNNIPKDFTMRLAVTAAESAVIQVIATDLIRELRSQQIQLTHQFNRTVADARLKRVADTVAASFSLAPHSQSTGAAVDPQAIATLVDYVLHTPNGVLTTSANPSFTNGMDLSSNFGQFQIYENPETGLRAYTSIMARAYTLKPMEDFGRQQKARAQQLNLENLTVEAFGMPPWEPQPHSVLIETIQQVVESLGLARFQGIRVSGGVEPTFFVSNRPTLDAVVIGPTLTGVHSPDEKADLSELGKIIDILDFTLRNLAQRQPR